METTTKILQIEIDRNFEITIENCVRRVLRENITPKEETPDLLTIKQALTQLLPFTEKTTRSKIFKREIPFRKVGGKILFSRIELIAWLKEGRKATKAEIEQKANDYLVKK